MSHFSRLREEEIILVYEASEERVDIGCGGREEQCDCWSQWLGNLDGKEQTCIPSPAVWITVVSLNRLSPPSLFYLPDSTSGSFSWGENTNNLYIRTVESSTNFFFTSKLLVDTINASSSFSVCLFLLEVNLCSVFQSFLWYFHLPHGDHRGPCWCKHEQNFPRFSVALDLSNILCQRITEVLTA